MYIPVIVSSWVSIYIKYIIEIISFYFTIDWFLIAKEQVTVDGYWNGNAGLVSEMCQIV